MKQASRVILSFSVLAILACNAEAREQIRAVGSSTVFPFVSAAAESFGNRGKFKTPIVEATGTGGGFKEFCAGVGANTPDIADASRKIKASEIELCKKNGVSSPIEVSLGFDGIVIANTRQSKHFNLTRKDIFLALAKQVPKNGKLVANPYTKWSEVNASLPEAPIAVYGPPPTSGTRDAFVEMVMTPSCKDLPEYVAAFPDEKAREAACHTLREDGKYIESGENDNLIIGKLKGNPDALGIFGYSFLEQNESTVQGSHVEGVAPTNEDIATGKYPIARPLYAYLKREHLNVIPGLKEFAAELSSDGALDPFDGYLTAKGLIPLPDDKRIALRAALTQELAKK